MKKSDRFKRDMAIYNLHLAQPELSMQEIADFFGVTKQRISQVIIKMKQNKTVGVAK